MKREIQALSVRFHFFCGVGLESSGDRTQRNLDLCGLCIRNETSVCTFHSRRERFKLFRFSSFPHFPSSAMAAHNDNMLCDPMPDDDPLRCFICCEVMKDAVMVCSVSFLILLVPLTWTFLVSTAAHSLQQLLHKGTIKQKRMPNV